LRILSLDQASKCGYSLFENTNLVKYGIFDVHDIKDNIERWDNIKQFLAKMVNTYNIEFVSIEDIQKQVNIKTYKDLAHLQGFLISWLYENNIPYEIVPPATWRQYCKIKGKDRKQKKANAQLFVKNKFGIDASEDEADAIGIGWYTVNNKK
jgi:Holliday junction resolvasome RuvABC endonuclease subunit